jgi:predicted DNA-binding transcriptional regulator AlpA
MADERYSADGVLTPTQLASRLGMSIQTIHRWRKEGKGPVWFKLGWSVFYKLDEVERWERVHRAHAS